jgi:hypothetical protein
VLEEEHHDFGGCHSYARHGVGVLLDSLDPFAYFSLQRTAPFCVAGIPPVRSGRGLAQNKFMQR